ncbi:MAG: MaoC family dehydratase N-terminal domain-containing protein [Dehalococcoidia bacterium]|nr:MaoC family dehydratase N-terminal domain-containing protein [Dehalococcoidia bacterium]
MADGQGNSTMITRETRNLIGRESEAVIWPVERGAIRKVLRALQDNGPQWKDLDDAASGTTVLVPPAYFMSIRAPELKDVKIDVPLRRSVAGGEEWSFFGPLRMSLGSSVVVKRRLSDIQEKQGKAGPMLLITYEDRFESETGQALASRRTTLIRL